MMSPTPVMPGEGAFVPREPGDLSFQRWLQDSQWHSAEAHRDHALKLLHRLLVHAHRTVPFHRSRIAAAGIDPAMPLTVSAWRRLPILTRRDVHLDRDALISSDVPRAHGEVLSNTSSGSTGTPVTVCGTTFDACVFKAFTLRHFLWHPHDFSGKIALIHQVKEGCARYPEGALHERWGDTATFPFATGPSVELSIHTSIRDQAEWLVRQDPDYLVSYPSNLMALALHFRDRAMTLPHLEQVQTLGEVVNPELRELVREVWDAPMVDVYSAQEVGIIADQCPQSARYHVAAEAVFVEVLDEDGQPCGAGQTGRVVVTPLFNYAQPLLRYALGDYAVAGDRCSCGRGLPVLDRILGRERNGLLVTSTGERYWPAFGSRTFANIAPVIQHQFVQHDTDWIEARLVTQRPLTRDEEREIEQRILARLPAPFRITFSYPEHIARNAGGKYENFVSRVDNGPAMSSVTPR